MNANANDVIVTSDSSNLVLGGLAGLGAALVGAAVWAAITVFSGYQIGWMAVGVGFLVAIAVRHLGRGRTPMFSIVGAVLALAGCLVGNALALVGFYARENSEAFFDVLLHVNPAGLMQAMVETGSPMDLLFYGIAIYEGFKLSVLPPAEPAAQAAQ